MTFTRLILHYFGVLNASNLINNLSNYGLSEIYKTVFTKIYVKFILLLDLKILSNVLLLMIKNSFQFISCI